MNFLVFDSPSFPPLPAVLNAGHMVPMDVPKIALDMITRFLGDKDFSAGNALVGVSLLNP